VRPSSTDRRRVREMSWVTKPQAPFSTGACIQRHAGVLTRAIGDGRRGHHDRGEYRRHAGRSRGCPRVVACRPA
jgi:hypothetical protein